MDSAFLSERNSENLIMVLVAILLEPHKNLQLRSNTHALITIKRELEISIIQLFVAYYHLALKGQFAHSHMPN